MRKTIVLLFFTTLIGCVLNSGTHAALPQDAQAKSDQAVKARVEAALNGNSDLGDAQIAVTVDQGIVALSGRISSARLRGGTYPGADLKQNLGAIVRMIPGVKDVRFSLALDTDAPVPTNGGTATPQNYPPQFPRPNAKQILSNDRVNVWDAYWMKNQPTPMHRHVFDVLSITLQGGTIRVTNVDGTTNQGTSKLGQVNFSRKGLTHAEEGLSDVPQHKIFLELKSPVARTRPAEDIQGAFPPEGTVKLVDNDRMIAWDYTWSQVQKVPVDALNFDTVTVFLVGGTIRSMSAQDNAKDIVRNPGDVVYTAQSAETHTEQAVSGSPRAIIVQLK